MIPVHVSDIPGYRPLSEEERQRMRAHVIRDIAVALRNFFDEPYSMASGHVEPISEDTYTHLVSLAKDGNETIFKEYAQMVGVKPEHLDELWTGTRKRVTP